MRILILILSLAYVNAFGDPPAPLIIRPGQVNQPLQMAQESAARKEPSGLIYLGYAYAAGYGVPQDLVEAYAYYNLAVSCARVNTSARKAAISGLDYIKTKISNDGCLAGQKRSRELLKEIDDNIAKKAVK
jgi:TPR repeat protein